MEDVANSEVILGWLILGTVGLIQIVAAFAVLIWGSVLDRQTLATTGTVVALIADRDLDGVTYAPRVRFTAFDGSVVEFTDDLRANPPQYRVGEQTNVFYHRKNFQRARIGTRYRFNFMAGLLMVMGLMFFGAGLVGLYLYSFHG